MPYTTINELPAHIKKYEKIVQRQWMHVFNTVFKKTSSEARAFKAANSILKKRVSKEKNSPDCFNSMVDRWLGKLDG